ncbi:MAG: hypothetical protein J2P46_16220, partial [Zavarzinella sp.]|nr:hypothetical protein [Zavarzinella sp.]
MTRCLLAAAVSALVLAVPAPGQALLPHRGSEVFRFALHTSELKPVPATAVDEMLNNPPDSLIIVLGDTSNLHTLVASDRLKRFVLAGGAVLIATDSMSVPAFGGGRFDLGWSTAFNITVTGATVTADRDHSYHGSAGQPFIKPRPRFALRPGPSPYDLFDGVDLAGPGAVATDRPSEMLVPNQDQLPEFRISNLAGYADGARRLRDNRPVNAALNHFAVSLLAEQQSGRLLVFANRNVFANGMLGFKESANTKEGYEFDNGNWALAGRTIRWLRDRNDGKRTRCLFIEDGRIIDHFADELPPPPKPPIPNIPPDVLANILLNHSNGVINELQEKNFFNRAMEGFFGFPRIVRAFLLAATLLFLFYGFRWLARGHRKLEPAATTGPAQQAALLPRGGVLRQRTAAQIEVGNLSEAAGRRVRDRFDVLGGRPGPAGGMPPVLIASDVADAPLLRQT